MALIDDLLGLGFDITQAQNLADQIQTFGTEAQTKAEEIGTQAYESMQFKPFTVTSGVGGVTTTADGSTAMQLTPEQQALRNTLFGGSHATVSLLCNLCINRIVRRSSLSSERLRTTKERLL